MCACEDEALLTGAPMYVWPWRSHVGAHRPTRPFTAPTLLMLESRATRVRTSSGQVPSTPCIAHWTAHTAPLRRATPKPPSQVWGSKVRFMIVHICDYRGSSACPCCRPC
eukprot:363607-Chlamydomonas_euryale.AAC.7